LDSSAEDFLAEKGFDQKFGARPLKRAIQKYLEDPLAEEMLLNNIKEGNAIIAKKKTNSEELEFTVESESEEKHSSEDEKEKA